MYYNVIILTKDYHMAKPEKLKQLDAQQVALVNEQFESYKIQIVKGFIDTFGSSYQTAEQFQNNWHQEFKYTQKCEEFLKSQSKLFLILLPTDNVNYDSPKFFINLISKICRYLAKYTCRKNKDFGASYHELFEHLFTNNPYIQNRIKQYNKQYQETMAVQQQTKPVEPVVKTPRKRQHINAINAKPIELSKNEERKLNAKSVNARIREKRKQLGLPLEKPNTLTDEQYIAMIEKHRATIKISIAVRRQKGE